MKAITKYRADDGAEFDCIERCERHERLCADIAKAMEPMGERPKLGDGDHFEHAVKDCLQVKRNMLAIVRRELDPEGTRFPVLKHPDDAIHPMSAVGRIVDDYGGLLNKAWGRLCCISFTTGREYEQPYFTLHEHEATERMEMEGNK